MKICSTEGCEKPHYAMGGCRNHYQQDYYRRAIKPNLKQTPRHSVTQWDVETKTGVCVICGPVSIRPRKGSTPQCGTVRDRTRNAYRNGIRPAPATRRRWKYGLTESEYEELIQQHGGLCGICGCPPDRPPLFVDHDHATGVVRGLLCRHCNWGLGHFRDDPQSLERAINYLNAHSVGPNP